MTDITEIKITEFWQWFQSIAPGLALKGQDPKLFRELDRRITSLNPRLSWEIGPGLSKPWQLVISPNLDVRLRKVSRLIVARAPVLPDWEFYSARQAKKWSYQVEIGSDRLPIDASEWGFVLLRYPDGSHEILLKGKKLPPLTKDERWHAAAITLESILGEDTVMDRVNEFELVDELEPQFAGKERPIQLLRDAIAGTHPIS